MRGSRDGSVAAADGSGSAGSIGEAAIRVEWKAVPTTARQSGGRTACNTPRAPAVTPTTMWGIPETFVLTDKAAAPGEVLIVLADCALAPRIAIASTLVIESAVDRPAKVMLSKQGTLAALGAMKPVEPRVIQLPISGHAVRVGSPWTYTLRATSTKGLPWRGASNPPQDLPPAEFISREVDPILEKISAHGIQSLTAHEREILEAARAKMERR